MSTTSDRSTREAAGRSDMPMNDTRRRRAVLEEQKKALKIALNGGTLYEVLNALTHSVERQSANQMHTALFLVSQDGTRLLKGATGNLPSEYVDAVLADRIGPNSGSCATAAFLKSEIVVKDIATDPLWANFKHLVLPHGLQASWSVPVFSSARQIVGVLSVLYENQQEPDEADRRSVELLSRTAGTVIEWFSELERREEVESTLQQSDQHWRGLMNAAVLELTERAQTEEALKESEDQFRDFSNNIQNLAWIAQPDGWTRWHNRRWYEYTGTTPEQVEGLGWISVYHPDHIPRIEEFLTKAWDRGEQWELTAPLRGADGQYRWFLVRAYPVKNSQGKVTRWIGTSTDIHDKWLIQEELRQSEDRLQQVLDFMPQIVWSAQPNGEHDFFNEGWYSFTGLRAEKGEDQWAKVLHPDDYPRREEIWKRCLKSGEAYEIEYRMRRHDGEYRWMLARGMPFRRSDNSIERWYGTCTDIHDTKTMAENLELLIQERTKALKRSNEDLQQFAHVASHDFREPVRKIKLFVDLIEDRFRGQLPEQVTQNLQKIQKSARRLASMIEGVLLYSSLDAESLLVENVDLDRVVSDVEEDLELMIAERQAVIHYEKLPVIKGVPTMVYQLIYNLVRNALKFSHPDRQPEVRISSRLTNSQAKMYYEILVEDNGIGFNNAFAESIFMTFIRLHTKDMYEGTGIGLALCKKIVERHGGTITAIGREGRGATFRILWPM